MASLSLDMPLPESKGPSQVSKAIPPHIDLGHLMVVDYGTTALSQQQAADVAGREMVLKEMTRDNVQILMNELFSLERKTDTDGTFVTLPLAAMPLPRSKPLPDTLTSSMHGGTPGSGQKEKTKWQQFAERKGIKKNVKIGKKDSHTFDAAHQDYLPKHGSKSAKNHPMADWCEELAD